MISLPRLPLRSARRSVIPLLAIASFLGGIDRAIAQVNAPERPRFTPAEQQQLMETGAGMVGHLVRVRIEVQPVVHRIDGLKLDRPWVLEGICGGLVVAPDPLILISGSSCRPDHAGLNIGIASSLRDPPKRRYTLLFGDGDEVPATLWRHERAINVFLLKPADHAVLPDRLPSPASFEGLTRPKSGELMGLAAYLTPDVNARTHVQATTLQPGKDGFARPVLLAAGLHQLGMPVFFSDGRMAGIVNLAPPDEERITPRVDPRAAAGTEGERDPLEWATGFRRPVLMTRGDLAPFIESLYTTSGSAVPFAPLGLSLHADGEELRIGAVTSGGPAERVGLIAGEVLLQVGERRVSSLEEVGDALAAASIDERGLLVIVRRDERDVEFRLDVVPSAGGR